jgi:L-aspartate semialdehyde sulfurtransferase ferredoxin
MYSKVMLLRFPREIVNQAIVVNLVKRYDLSFNILKATIYPRKEGMVVMELSGNRKNYNAGVKYLKDVGIKVEPVGQDIRRNEEKCYHCGICTAVCPTGALHIERPVMTVAFDSDRCSACELCVISCPAHAMEVNFDRALIE